MSETKSTSENQNGAIPVRGSLRLMVSTSSPQVIAGSDFSIFVVIQNPYDVPITIQQVQTHIPIELIDVNGLKMELVKRESDTKSLGMLKRIYNSILSRLTQIKTYSGIAIAVGTDFDPTVDRELFKMDTMVSTMGEGSSIVGLALNFPQNPTSEELDQIFRRISDYRKGLIPVQLQPGDSMVRQFVLRTRHWLFFTPLSHKFQIQVNYSSDGIDHTDTITYEQNIRSAFSAIIIGSITGAILGTLLKTLRGPSAPAITGWSVLQALIVSSLSSIAVVIAFARKSSVQPIVSVEDFWGGALLGFTVGFFGFDQFLSLFGGSPEK